MRLVDSALWLPCHSEPVCNTEFVVENLTPGSGYRFRVAAVNTAGSGEPVELPQTVQLGELVVYVVYCNRVCAVFYFSSFRAICSADTECFRIFLTIMMLYL